MGLMAIVTEPQRDDNQLLRRFPVQYVNRVADTATRVLIIGATGFIGRFVTEASLAAGHNTYVLIRSGSTTPTKFHTLRTLQERGATLIHGCMKDQGQMERILSGYKIDVVISAVGGEVILDQLNLIEAIKTVGTVKRFLPSEFGHDIDRAAPVEPGLTLYLEKRKIRRAVEAAEIPYTYICCNSIAAWPYHDNTHPAELSPPLDQFKIYGDGSVKAYFVAGEDIGKITIKTVNDVRTLNKMLHFRPPSNCVSINEMASLWEKKIKRTLPRVVITEQDLLDAAAEMSIPRSVVAALTHDIFIKGCQINFSVEGPNDIETGRLYPDTPYRTLDECFDDYLVDQPGAADDGNAIVAAPNPLPKILPATGVIVGLS